MTTNGNGGDKPETQKIKLERLMPVGMEANYVDHYLLQNLPNDMYVLSLYQSEPPVSEDKDAEEESLLTARAYCRARLLLGQKQLQELMEVIQDHLEKECKRKVED